MTLNEIYDKLFIMLVGEDEFHGYGVQLHNGVFDKEAYEEILKLVKVANNTILASPNVNSIECVKVVNLVTQFFGDTLFYLYSLKNTEQTTDEFIDTILKLQTSFGVPYNPNSSNKPTLSLKDQLDKISQEYHDSKDGYDKDIRAGHFNREKFEKIYHLFQEIAESQKENSKELSTFIKLYSNFVVDTTAILVASNHEDMPEIIAMMKNLF